VLPENRPPWRVAEASPSFDLTRQGFTLLVMGEDRHAGRNAQVELGAAGDLRSKVGTPLLTVSEPPS
jgi:hypothetical protein